MAKAWIGVSGWTFPGWKKVFYPKELPIRRELEYASRALNSIEINGTFYSLQKPETFQKWYNQTPADFIFSVKAPQYITHICRLKEIEKPLAKFLASGLFCLREKLGPILWQFPPNVKLKDDRFEKFLSLLPHTSRHAFEFRHPSFAHPDFLALLKEHNVAFVIAHAGGEKAPYVEDLTSKNFVYVRLHGEGKEYKKGYTPLMIKKWAEKVKGWMTKSSKRDVFIYFSNDAKVYAPASAINLLKILKITREQEFEQEEAA